jgi:hypothetical protein
MVNNLEEVSTQPSNLISVVWKFLLNAPKMGINVWKFDTSYNFLRNEVNLVE